MTVYKQRFSRWNFFFSSGLYWNFEYLFLDWKLGWWEVGAKVFVWQEVCMSALALTRKCSGVAGKGKRDGD